MPRAKKSATANVSLDKQIKSAEKKVALYEGKLKVAKADLEKLQKEKALQADLARLAKVLVAKGVSVDEAIKLVEDK